MHDASSLAYHFLQFAVNDVFLNANAEEQEQHDVQLSILHDTHSINWHDDEMLIHYGKLVLLKLLLPHHHHLQIGPFSFSFIQLQLLSALIILPLPFQIHQLLFFIFLPLPPSFWQV